MEPSVVYVVEDDPAVRKSLVWMLETVAADVNFQVQTYAAPSEVLAAFAPTTPGCLVLDLRLPEMTGLELRDALVERGCELPFIIITGDGEVPDVISAMHMGAVDFIQKPVQVRQLTESVTRAVERDRQRRVTTANCEEIRARLDTLTPRELEVLDLVVEGYLNKQTAKALNVSMKTVESHRGNIMKKMQADSVAHLVRMVIESGWKRGEWRPRSQTDRP